MKLSKKNMDQVLLVQTRVPGGVGLCQNRDKGMGRINVKTCKLGFTQLVSKYPRHEEKLNQTGTLFNYIQIA